MKRVFLLTCVVFIATAFDAAQNAPKAEIFGGYSYLRADISGITSENFNGWEASVTGNRGRASGITADVSGHYKSFTGLKVNDKPRCSVPSSPIARRAPRRLRMDCSA